MLYYLNFIILHSGFLRNFFDIPSLNPSYGLLKWPFEIANLNKELKLRNVENSVRNLCAFSPSQLKKIENK